MGPSLNLAPPERTDSGVISEVNLIRSRFGSRLHGDAGPEGPKFVKVNQLNIDASRDVKKTEDRTELILLKVLIKREPRLQQKRHKFRTKRPSHSPRAPRFITNMFHRLYAGGCATGGGCGIGSCVGEY